MEFTTIDQELYNYVLNLGKVITIGTFIQMKG